MMKTQYLTSSTGLKLAYQQYTGQRDKAGLLWLGGYRSDMAGTKAQSLGAWAVANHRSFLAIDYSGHGESGGDFLDGCISSWRQDVLDAIDCLTRGPLVIVGSSMGGWLALLAALARCERVAGLVLVAPAPDFTERLMWESFPGPVQRQIIEEGVWMRPSEYGTPDPITHRLIEDGRNWLVLDKPIPFSGYVDIIQGAKDKDVPWPHAYKLVEKLQSDQVSFTLIKHGDHRLSEPQDLARLKSACYTVCQNIDELGSTLAE